MAYKESEVKRKQEDKKKFSQIIFFHQLYNEVTGGKGVRKRKECRPKQITDRILEISLAFCRTILFENTLVLLVLHLKPLGSLDLCLQSQGMNP
jgi:hypothetical protein